MLKIISIICGTIFDIFVLVEATYLVEWCGWDNWTYLAAMIFMCFFASGLYKFNNIKEDDE